MNKYYIYIGIDGLTYYLDGIVDATEAHTLYTTQELLGELPKIDKDKLSAFIARVHSADLCMKFNSHRHIKLFKLNLDINIVDLYSFLQDPNICELLYKEGKIG